MPEVRLNGVRYYYELKGRGQPLLLLHGFTGSSQNWGALSRALAADYQVLTVDLLGHGRTEAPAEAGRYAMGPAAADLVTLLDELAIRRTAVLGYSMGGRLALYTAVTYPARLSRLILESSSPGLATVEERRERTGRDRALADWIEAQGIEPFVDRWQKLPLWRSQQQLSAADRSALRRQRLQNNVLGLAHSLRGMGTGVQPSLWPQLAQIPYPVLQIVGELDTKFVQINQQMSLLLPAGRLVSVAAAGHTVHLEKPDLFLQIVQKFLN